MSSLLSFHRASEDRDHGRQRVLHFLENGLERARGSRSSGSSHAPAGHADGAALLCCPSWASGLGVELGPLTLLFWVFRAEALTAGVGVGSGGGRDGMVWGGGGSGARPFIYLDFYFEIMFQASIRRPAGPESTVELIC